MSVTVIIVNFNSGDLLGTCLKRLEEQTTIPNRIIVVDNASADDSQVIAPLFPNVALLQLSKNCGFAFANNWALKHADTEFVALLNPDAFPEPNWLENLIAAARRYPKAAAFGSRQLCSDNPSVLDGVGDHYHFSGLVWRGRHGVVQEEDDLLEKEIFSPCAAGALYRRQALIDIGGFDDDFFCYVEDVDLGFRLRLAGYKSMYVPEAVIVHIGSATTGGQRSDFSVYHGHRNLVWTFVKNMPGKLFWLLLVFHLLLNLATVCVFIFRGQGGVILRSKRDAIRGLPVAWKKRMQIQAGRTIEDREIWSRLDKSVYPNRR